MFFNSHKCVIENDIEKALSYKKKNAAHIMMFSKIEENSESWPNLDWKKQYAVLMHLRFDGSLGFPGGLIDKDEDPETALYRELVEEQGIEDIRPERSDYLYSTIKTDDDLAAHFYVKEISYELFKKMERMSTQALHFGSEVFGTVRIPLYQYDKVNGFPTFLKNQMVGNSRDQLVNGLYHHKILDKTLFDDLCNFISGNCP